MLLFPSKCQYYSPTVCFKFPDKVEEEEEKAESAKMASAALSPTDRNVSTAATAIVFVVCFLLVFIYLFFFLFTVLPCNLIGAEAISPNTHFVLCYSKFCLAQSTASCKRKRNVA